MRSDTGTEATAFLDKLETVSDRGQLQEMFDSVCDKFPAGDLRGFLRKKCHEKAKEKDWTPLIEPEFGC